MKPGGVATGALNTALAGIPGNAGKAGDGLHATAVKAQSYAQWVNASAKATTALANAQDAAVSKQLAYGNDILTSANDAQTFHDKLKASTGQIGLHTQAQRDSFGAANTYIGDLSRQATAAISSGHGTDAAIGAIRSGPARPGISEDAQPAVLGRSPDAGELPASAVIAEVHQHRDPRDRGRQVVGDGDDDHAGRGARPAEHRRRTGCRDGPVHQPGHRADRR